MRRVRSLFSWVSVRESFAVSAGDFFEEGFADSETLADWEVLFLSAEPTGEEVLRDEFFVEAFAAVVDLDLDAILFESVAPDFEASVSVRAAFTGSIADRLPESFDSPKAQGRRPERAVTVARVVRLRIVFMS